MVMFHFIFGFISRLHCRMLDFNGVELVSMAKLLSISNSEILQCVYMSCQDVKKPASTLDTPSDEQDADADGDGDDKDMASPKRWLANNQGPSYQVCSWKTNPVESFKFTKMLGVCFWFSASSC